MIKMPYNLEMKLNLGCGHNYLDTLKNVNDFELKDFALIPDHPEDGGLISNATENMADELNYGCGCFWFRKIAK